MKYNIAWAGLRSTYVEVDDLLDNLMLEKGQKIGSHQRGIIAVRWPKDLSVLMNVYKVDCYYIDYGGKTGSVQFRPEGFEWSTKAVNKRLKRGETYDKTVKMNSEFQVIEKYGPETPEEYLFYESLGKVFPRVYSSFIKNVDESIAEDIRIRDALKESKIRKLIEGPDIIQFDWPEE